MRVAADSEPRQAVVGFGGNLGRPPETFVAALALLAERRKICALSQWYVSAPIGPTQPWYLNAAVLIDLSGPSRSLLWDLQDIERQLGRQRHTRWGARTLDLDLLWVAAEVSSAPSLELPHPRLHLRAFALLPLLDVAPDAQEPIAGRPYIRYVPQLQGQQISQANSTHEGWTLRRPVAVCE